MARTAELRSTADTQRPVVEARLVDLYKMGRAGYWKLLLDVDDLQAIGRAYRTAAAMNQIDRERITEHQRTLDALASERQALEAQVKSLSRLQAEAVSARAAIDRAVSAHTRLVESIDARRDLNAQLTGELEAAQQRLQGTVAQLGGQGGGRGAPAPAVQGCAAVARAAGIVTSRFGRQKPTASGPGLARTGIDLSLSEGQPVRAVHEGVVAYADQFTGYGNLVIIDHGEGTYSLYGYLISMDVARGDHLDAQAPARRLRPQPRRQPCPGLRVTGRRRRGRSLTMAETVGGTLPSGRFLVRSEIET